uniref:Inosine/uridine-preferring nucleoside hydrolase domain-containing protein n=1 Tax=Bionectria ochroleuca TaxID=29856 RepID=A0A8H7N6B2_BIOOC
MQDYLHATPSALIRLSGSQIVVQFSPFLLVLVSPGLVSSTVSTSQTSSSSAGRSIFGTNSTVKPIRTLKNVRLNMAPTRIILDTDLSMGAGADVDDGFALALAHADPNIQLDLVTTVNGNTDVESATILTGVLMDRLNVNAQDTPLVRGAETPMMYSEKRRIPAAHVSAMKNTARQPVTGKYAALAMVEHIMANPGEITVVAIGPLTNIATAILLEPRIKTAVKELVIMGGVFFGSMYSHNKPGEFNVFTDPEAARAVLYSGISQRWIGLDVTLQVRLTMEDADSLKKSPSKFAQFAGQASATYIDYQAVRFPGRPKMTSVPMHDPWRWHVCRSRSCASTEIWLLIS